MAHEYDRGVREVRSGSSWHGLEELGVMVTSEDMIGHGERCGAWPVALHSEALFTSSGLDAQARAIIADYVQHEPRVLGVVGDIYRATACEEWRGLVRAAVCAGAKPVGAFSLRGGSRVLATFEVGQQDGLKTYLLLADSFNGDLKLTCGFTSIDVVCANTLAVAFQQDGQDFARLKHTASLAEKVKILTETIPKVVESGQKIKATFDLAQKSAFVSREAFEHAFDLLFPEAPEGASKNAVTRAQNERTAAVEAMAHPLNRRTVQANLGTLWNAATFLVDRKADGSPRACKGDADKLDSLLFGTRAKRIQEIQTLIEVLMRDGSVQTMTQTQALDQGVPRDQVGRAVLKDLGLEYED